MIEKDMYMPIKIFLEEQNYVVKAEVLNNDITAIKDDFLLIVEMKNTFNTKLIHQGCQRQKMTDHVYIAIPKPTQRVLKSKSYKEKVYITKRLNLGLMTVDETSLKVDVIVDPKEFVRRKNKKRTQKLLKEFHQRQTAFNVGGVTKTKIITSYKEGVLLLASHLLDGPKSIKELKELTSNPKCSSILQKNYYQWFDKIERGIYAINELGEKELILYKDVLDQLHEKKAE